ncbi:MAG: hypothetical protein KGQ60_18805, partial [Planctomycetes bacterium]|nr:hypothetical protein [Planctomycetota bacterium]
MDIAYYPASQATFGGQSRAARPEVSKTSLLEREPSIGCSRSRCSIRYRCLMSVFASLVYVGVVAGVSAYDIFLTIEYASWLPQLEENPIGRWLMNLEYSSMYDLSAPPPNVTYFVLLKVLGTSIVLVSLMSLIRWRAHIGHAVSLGVSA